MKSLSLLLVCLAFVLTGCTSISTHSSTSLKKYKRVFVEHLLTDNLRVDDLIVAELQRRGYEVAKGPLTMMPDGMDLVLSYNSRSEWDFRTYLIEMSVSVRTVISGEEIAAGHIYQPNIRLKSPPEMVQALIGPLFPPR
ncbi:MAG TPA: hypothetical protein PLU52_08670 [Opitutaceae bacterium]|nr:hypothetical protein [Opitutaceae bacterium]HND62494.1 hypothetical protein [Opitutaceae bacterium]